jgi:hypothetical protein
MATPIIMPLKTGAKPRGRKPIRFPLGEVLATPRALEALTAAGLTLDEMLDRHRAGDWGDISAAQRRVNDSGVASFCHLASAYLLPDGQRLTVFTRGDRTHTLVHLAPH